ncbi:MAG: hypothetical protein JJ863_38230 [Deltaproteobacteria bacterium]|nr:hypothetical protein [Deltaproteobacteria bacterium]
MARLRILYFGVPLGAEVLRQAGFDPVVSVLAPLDMAGRRRVRRRSEGLVLGDPAVDPAVRRLLAGTRPDALFSFFYPRRIEADVLALAPRGAFGTHPSLLPRWRGPDPYYWALREGDAETGVTLHRLEPTYDTGPIVARASVSITETDDAWSLAKKLDRPALRLLGDAAERLSRGEALEGEPQPEPTSPWARRPTDDDLAIDWQQPADAILRAVRAAAPEPGATAAFGERWIEVLDAEPCDDAPPTGLRPAEAWRTADGWAVRCGEGALRILEARDAEGDVDLDELFASVRD